MTQQTFRQAIFLCFSDFYFFIFLKRILQEMMSYRLGTVNDFHWEFKPVLSYIIANLTLSQHFLEKKRKEKMHLFSPTRPLRR